MSIDRESITLQKYNLKMDRNLSKVITAWAPNSKAMSTLISLEGTIAAMGKVLSDVTGVYKVAKSKDSITINLIERIENVA